MCLMEGSEGAIDREKWIKLCCQNTFDWEIDLPLLRNARSGDRRYRDTIAFHALAIHHRKLGMAGINGTATINAITAEEELSKRITLFPSAGIRAYEQLGFRAFGTPGKMATGIAITLQNIGCEFPAWLSQGDLISPVCLGGWGGGGHNLLPPLCPVCCSHVQLPVHCQI